MPDRRAPAAARPSVVGPVLISPAGVRWRVPVVEFDLPVTIPAGGALFAQVTDLLADALVLEYRRRAGPMGSSPGGIARKAPAAAGSPIGYPVGEPLPGPGTSVLGAAGHPGRPSGDRPRASGRPKSGDRGPEAVGRPS